MDLLMVYGDPRGKGYGGVEEHTVNLIQHLSKKPDLNVNVLTYGDETQIFLKNHIKYRVLKKYSNNMFAYIFFLPLDFFRILREINELKPDLVHFQGTHPLYSFAAVVLKRKYPTLITVHGIMAVEMDFHSEKNFFLRWSSKFLERISLSYLDNIIVVAPQIEAIVKTLTKSRTFMIPNGIDLETIPNIPALNNSKPFIMYMGVLISRKGIYGLLDAFSLVKNEIEDICLFIAGSGQEENNLRKTVKRLGLQKDVKFLGFLKEEKKYSYLKSSEIVILPSLWESLPITVLEGMGCGKPIIASEVGGIPYLVEDGFNGFLVKPGDVKDLADKIAFLLKNKPMIEEMGVKSGLKAKTFDWTIITDKTLEVYQEVSGSEINESSNGK